MSQDTLRRLNEHRNRWMMEREASLKESSLDKHYHMPVSTSKSGSNPLSSTAVRKPQDLISTHTSVPMPEPSAHSVHNELSTDCSAISRKLFDKMKAAVDEELKQRRVSNVDAESIVQRKLEGILKQEMSQHTCSLCCEVMRPPTKSPILLVPCGHTFCLSCVDRHALARAKLTGMQLYKPRVPNAAYPISTCPMCKCAIDSQAFNRPLSELLKSIDEASTSNNYTNSKSSNVTGVHQQNLPSCLSKDGEDQTALFSEALRASNMRVRILKEEVSQIKLEEEKAALNEKRYLTQLGDMKDTESLILSKIDELTRNLREVQSSIQISTQAMEEAGHIKSEMEKKRILVEKSLEGVIKDVSKYSILSKPDTFMN